ncbi:MAG: adenylate/guanylate cyclase domain-containing protein [Comamonadaceae bacterium]|nr:MAG: adenylate/guanylate cyclase domain-containing protein [Comamonadaceae bacterium]
MEASSKAGSGAQADAWRSLALRVLSCLGLLGVLQWMPLWETLQRAEFDLLTSLTAPPPPPAGVLVVGIDEPSLAQLGLSPPLPRQLHSDLLKAAADAGAAAVGIDILFSEARDAAGDAALGRALQGPLPVVLASAEVEVRSSQVAQMRQRVESVFTGARHGVVRMSADEDGVVRRLPEGDDAFWRVLAASAGRPVSAPPPGALLRYYAPEVALPYVHFTQALQAGTQLAPGAFQGKTLVVGQNTPVGGVDQFATPLRLLGAGTLSGVFLHATALHNGLAGDWIVPAPAAGPALLSLAVLLAVSALTRRWRGLHAAGWTLAALLLAVAGAVAAFVAGWWWSVLPTAVVLGLHLNLGAAASYWRERRRRHRLQQQFASYLSAEVVHSLAAQDAAPRLGGERRVLTLLFSDLAGFTAASEQLPPEAVAAALNAYFTRMTEAVHAQGGTLDKFIGDAVMAFWNAPVPAADHAWRALACARAMQHAMQALRQEWAGTPFASVHMRIGLHTGDAAVGHLGSSGRFTYTAVGDAVNTAARLEGANKAFGTGILISEATRTLLPPDAQAGLLWLDGVVLAGRSAGLDVYTPCDDPGLAAIGQSLRGALRSGDWPAARAACADWEARAAAQAPAFLAQASRLRERVEALAMGAWRADATGSAASYALALDKS